MPSLRRESPASPGSASAAPCSRCGAASARPRPPSRRPAPPSPRCAACRRPPPRRASAAAASPPTALTTRRISLDRCRPIASIADATLTQREVPHLAVAHLLEVELRAGPRRRNADRGQQLARLQHGHPRDVDARADEVVLGVDDALAAARRGSPSARRARPAPARCPTGSPPRSGRRRKSRARG